MKSKKELRLWVKVALLLLPEVVIIGLLFFVALKIDKAETIVEIHHHDNSCMLEVFYE